MSICRFGKRRKREKEEIRKKEGERERWQEEEEGVEWEGEGEREREIWRSFPVRKLTISYVRGILRELLKQNRRCASFPGSRSRHLDMDGYD